MPRRGSLPLSLNQPAPRRGSLHISLNQPAPRRGSLPLSLNQPRAEGRYLSLLINPAPRIEPLYIKHPTPRRGLLSIIVFKRWMRAVHNRLQA